MRKSGPMNNKMYEADIILSSRKNNFIEKYNYGKGIVDLGEYVIRHTSGCVGSCMYCYAKRKFSDSKIKLFVNYKKLFSEIDSLVNSSGSTLYFNAGENADSLFFDDINFLTYHLVPYFAKIKNAYLELRTKSNNIKNLLNLTHNCRTIVAASLNPQPLIEKYEMGCASLDERLFALKLCKDKGYPVGIRLDPIFYLENWKTLYRDLVEKVIAYLEPPAIHSITLGTFRYTKDLALHLGKTREGNNLIIEEFVLCEDGKFRYFKGIRIAIYKFLIEIIKKHSPKIPVLLSSETKEVWKSCMGT